MRILDVDNEKSLKNIILYLTLSEAKEMNNDLSNLIKNVGKPMQHEHINDEEYEHEVTLTIYDENDLAGFDEISRKVIREDK
jgi:hypothetical protein